MSKPIACVDFDGVIHSYKRGWEGANVVNDPPVPGALAWLRDMQQTFDVCIYSSRSSQDGGILAMREWLWAHATNEFGNPRAVHDFMNGLRFPAEKPAAFITIDDRAICFEGDFAALEPARIAAFRPWNKRPPLQPNPYDDESQ